MLPNPNFQLRNKLFSCPVAVPDGTGRFTPSSDWENKNITNIELLGRNFRCHKLAFGPICELFEAWERAGLIDLVLTIDRIYEFRPSTHGHYFHPHSHGNAFDINEAWNPLNSEPAGENEYGTVKPLCAIAREHGFWCGADWASPTGKHFELVRV